MARGIATRAANGGNDVTLLGHGAGDAYAVAGELPGDVKAGTVVRALLLTGGKRRFLEGSGIYAERRPRHEIQPPCCTSAIGVVADADIVRLESLH